MFSGTRDNPPPETTLASVYMWKRFPYRPIQTWPWMIIHNPYWIIKCSDVPLSLSFPRSFNFLITLKLSVNETEPQIETFDRPKQFLWENNSRQFVDTILLGEFQSRLLILEEMHFDLSRNGINLTTQAFTDLLNDISLRSLKLNYQKKTRKKQHSKKWFDQECWTST